MGPTQPPIQWVPGVFAGVKQPGRDADHSPSSDGEVKNEWSYTFSLTPLWRARRQLYLIFTYSLCTSPSQYLLFDVSAFPRCLAVFF